ncbi:MAG: NAD(+)/NADH kinase [Raoultibacter sp.]
MHILIVRNNSNTGALDASLMLATFLGAQGLDYTLLDSSDIPTTTPCGGGCVGDATAFDLVVVLGGDGTILRSARYVGTSGIPILGINFGHLGFLSNASEEGVVAIVAAALAGDVVRECRTNLRIDVVCEGDDEKETFYGEDQADITLQSTSFDEDDEPRGGQVGTADAMKEGAPFAQRTFFALNELAITRGASGRIIDIDLSIAGSAVAKMRGDGLVIATATGSTAYALSAGGPLVAPGFGGLVAVPLAPHTLHSRAIVTDPSDVVEVALAPDGAGRESVLFADGEVLAFDSCVKRVMVRKGEAPSVLLRYKHEGFYAHASRVFF